MNKNINTINENENDIDPLKIFEAIYFFFLILR